MLQFYPVLLYFANKSDVVTVSKELKFKLSGIPVPDIPTSGYCKGASDISSANSSNMDTQA